MSARDYILFSIGAAIGASLAYVFTKRKIERECYEEYYAETHPKKEAEDGNDDICIVDSDDNFDRFREDLAEKREKARKIAEENGYIDDNLQNDSPYLIEFTEYSNSDVGYSSERVNWYPSVQKATNEIDDAEVDAYELCGISNIREIEKSGESVGYVRNDKLKLDIEVFICYADWPLDEDDHEDIGE